VERVTQHPNLFLKGWKPISLLRRVIWGFRWGSSASLESPVQNCKRRRDQGAVCESAEKKLARERGPGPRRRGSASQGGVVSELTGLPRVRGGLLILQDGRQKKAKGAGS